MKCILCKKESDDLNAFGHCLRCVAERKVTAVLLAVIILASLLFCSPARAENIVSLKSGVMNTKCKGISKTEYFAVSYEYKYKYLGLEAELGYFNNLLQETYYTKDMGMLHTFNIQGMIKYYPFKEGWYVGTGTGVYVMEFKEYYRGKAVVEPEMTWVVAIGHVWENGIFAEFKHALVDLDIESGVHPDGIIEDRSRMDSWSVMVGKKWRF